MSAYELNFPVIPRMNVGNDTKFHKGDVPFNKGKKWTDYMTEERAEELRKSCRKSARKLHKLKRTEKQREALRRHNEKIIENTPDIAVKIDGKWMFFASTRKASIALFGTDKKHGNISRSVRKGYKCEGLIFYNVGSERFNEEYFGDEY